MKKWELQNELKVKNGKFKVENLIDLLLKNRGLKTKKQIDDFLKPKIESLTAQNLGINKKDLSKGLTRIKKAIDGKELIIIFGDYDADGVNGTAILWETLNSLKANVMPYIPDRTQEGYGLSIKAIENLKKKHKEIGLIITVDNGIVANSAVEFANSLKIDVIITDHHIPAKSLPKAYSIIHSTLVCGAGVAYVLSREISNKPNDHLALAAIATVTDMMKLTNFNRAILVHGLQILRKTKRVGLKSLIGISAIDQNKIGVYEIGHIIGPRINAMGRLEHAMDSLRLLCTTNKTRADELSRRLSETNLQRQQLTFDSFLHAKDLVSKSKKKLLFVSHKIYEPGVIGLVAGKLTEEFYRPSVVVSVRENYSKASARSITGFNIIEFIRLSSHLLVDAGGHPGAAGFTVETNKIAELKKLLETLAEKNIAQELLTRKLRIDCELSLELINDELFASIQKLSPFGFGNPEPTFLAKGIIIEDMRLVGMERKHLKLELGIMNRELKIGGILFTYNQSLDLKIGDNVDIAYTISENEWNGNKKLELKIKDIKKN